MEQYGELVKSDKVQSLLQRHKITENQCLAFDDNRDVIKEQNCLQMVVDNRVVQHAQPVQKEANNTGLPDGLKFGMEQVSGYDLGHVKVNYNSPMRAAVQALAYAQGSDIHLGAGQERHLPHELGHVVQQMRGDVKVTKQFVGVGINDDVGLERGADRLGERALQCISNKGMDDNKKSMTLPPSIQVNDNKCLEAEADVMGSRALSTDQRLGIVQWQGIVEPNIQISKSCDNYKGAVATKPTFQRLSSYPIQRAIKVNDITYNDEFGYLKLFIKLSEIAYPPVSKLEQEKLQKWVITSGIKKIFAFNVAEYDSIQELLENLRPVLPEVKSGWISQEDLKICNERIGEKAFSGILESHVKRQKWSALSAIVKNIIMNAKSGLKNHLPLNNRSLIIDSNAAHLLITKKADLNKGDKQLQKQLTNIIFDKNITDLRLTNINVAELNDRELVIGQAITVKGTGKLGLNKEITLPVYGVELEGSREGDNYKQLYQQLIDHRVGENKGHADRSMMADIYYAKITDEASPHFVTGDLGITKKIKSKGEEADIAANNKYEVKKFDPEGLRLNNINIHTIQVDKEKKVPAEVKRKSVIEKINISKPFQDKNVSFSEKINLDKLMNFKVEGEGMQQTNINAICRILTENQADVYIIGGAVRDSLRGNEVVDVDLKTTMQYSCVAKLMRDFKLTISLTDSLNLVKVGKDPHSADINCAANSKLNHESDTLKKDASKRDFALNSLYIKYPNNPHDKTFELIDPLNIGKDNAEMGLLKFPQTIGVKDEREQTSKVIALLKENPHELARALKFIERDYFRIPIENEKWKERLEMVKTINEYIPENLKNNKNLTKDEHQQINKIRDSKLNELPILGAVNKTTYHLDDFILRGIIQNSTDILRKLVDADDAGKNISMFIHKTGFKHPMLLVLSMQRLGFPTEAIKIIVPDYNGVKY